MKFDKLIKKKWSYAKIEKLKNKENLKKYNSYLKRKNQNFGNLL